MECPEVNISLIGITSELTPYRGAVYIVNAGMPIGNSIHELYFLESSAFSLLIANDIIK